MIWFGLISDSLLYCFFKKFLWNKTSIYIHIHVYLQLKCSLCIIAWLPLVDENLCLFCYSLSGQCTNKCSSEYTQNKQGFYWWHVKVFSRVGGDGIVILRKRMSSAVVGHYELWSVSAFFIKKSIAGTSNIAACWLYVNGDRPGKSGAWRTGVSVASLNTRLNKSAMLARFIYLCNWNESYSCRKIFSGTWLLVSTWSDSKTTQPYQMEPLQHEWFLGRTQFAWKCFEA
jgi:hypothetical protein